MAKIVRKQQKIFGSNLTAAAGGIAEFGSLAAGAKVFTVDPAVIQSLSNYLDGWSGAIVGSNSPALEDFNAIDFLYAYQLAYIFQEGIAEWETGTTYFTGSLAQDGTGVIFRSIADNNQGNALSTVNKWQPFLRSSSGTISAPNSVGGATGVTVSGGVDQDIYLTGNASAWTVRTAANAFQWISVCYSPELNLYVAIASSGAGNRVMTSPDGINWTPHASADNTAAWNSVCWSPQLGLFVAVATTGTNRAMYSANGTAWTIHATADDTTGWNSVCWSPELEIFVAVGDAAGSNQIQSSVDGISWTARTTAESNFWTGVVYAKALHLFVAVANNGTHRVQTSPNGTTWTAQTAAAANTWQGISWSEPLKTLVAVAGSGTNRVMYSTNGVIWMAAPAASADTWEAVAWSDQMSIFVAVSDSGAIMSSPNGAVWTARTSPEANQWNGVVWSPDLAQWVVVGGSGTHRVLTMIPSTVTASPQIGNGSVQGQRLTLIGTDDEAQPVVQGVYLKKFSVVTFLWDINLTAWIQVPHA